MNWNYLGHDPLTEWKNLFDRAIILHLPTIPDASRREEREFWPELDQARPTILGALLDLVSVALRNIDSVQLHHRPRMADFVTWVVAALQALPALDSELFCSSANWFLAQYSANRHGAIEVGLEASPVAPALCTFMSSRVEWQGNATTLLTELEGCVPEESLRLHTWPKAPHVLSGRLRELARPLRETAKIDMQFQNSGDRLITIRRLIDEARNQAPQAPVAPVESRSNLAPPAPPGSGS